MHHQNQGANILVVDDEPRMCESLKYLLNSRNFNVRTALTGTDALNWVSNEDFDVAVLDIGLPDMDGIMLLTEIRDRRPDTDVVIITGNATLDSALSAIRNGAFDYLKKPFEYDQLLNTIRNILQQKNLRCENRQINGKLAASEERYRYLVQNSPDIIYILNEEGCFEYISDAVQPLLGFEPENLIGRHFSDIILEEDMDSCRWFFQERRTGDRATKGAELRLKVSGNGGGGSRYCEVRHLTVELKSTGMYEQNRNNGRSFIGTHGVARDVSRRKRLERQLKQMERMEAMGTLAAGIAHNFNNLLMGVQGNASLILLDLDEDHEHGKRLRSIIDYCQSGAELTGQLLGFARSTEYEIKPVDMNAVLTKSATMFGKARKEIQVRESLSPNIWLADADEKQMEQVLLNLYVNAWHAMPGGGELTLRTENIVIEKQSQEFNDLAPGCYVKISVEDTGTGIEESVQQRIFEPFFTTKEVGQGTGLGLASAFGIVKNLGGTILVQSYMGKGTAFHIFLPASEGTQILEKPEESKIINGTGTVLLVDDETMIIEVLTDFLKTLGYKTITASSGKEAIPLYQDQWKNIDLVILDMVMPEMDGGRVFEALKRINPDVKAIVASGHCLEGRCEDIVREGCKGFIQKPFDLGELSNLIKDVMAA